MDTSNFSNHVSVMYLHEEAYNIVNIAYDVYLLVVVAHQVFYLLALWVVTLQLLIFSCGGAGVPNSFDINACL